MVRHANWTCLLRGTIAVVQQCSFGGGRKVNESFASYTS